MFGGRLGFNFSGKRDLKEEDEEDEVEEEDYENEGTSEEEEEDRVEEDIDAFLIPSDNEKKAVLAAFDTMRKESLFCDISFVCQGVLFRAHRVIVSSWSRWLRGFLSESPEEEVLSLDIFEPLAFRAVLDYMYGVALEISVKNAESIIKVVRRLELQKLEQQCWRYLITALDSNSNAEFLHDLADRYDCPPLKLAAWKILKERIPDIESFPNQRKKKGGKFEESKKTFAATGLTGPADPAFRNARVSYGSRFTRLAEQEQYQDRYNMPSVFNDNDPAEEEYEEEDEEQDDGEEESKANTKSKRLEELEESASATEVINAWALRLKEVYAKCATAGTTDNEEAHQLKLHEETPNVKLKRTPRKRASNADRSALLGEIGDVDNQSEATASHAKGKTTEHAKPNENNLRYPQTANGIDWEEVLTNFYSIMNMPAKINGISTILKTWIGKEDEMLHSLVEKYEKTIPKKLMKYLQHILLLSETRTDSSFRKPLGKKRADI